MVSILGEKDPDEHDLATTGVLTHPDVVFPGGDSGWFGADERATSRLIEIYAFA
jgi:hypothetical protein